MGDAVHLASLIRLALVHTTTTTTTALVLPLACPRQALACSPSSALTCPSPHATPASTSAPPPAPTRYDLAFLAPFSLDELPRAQLWLPGQCCEWQPDPFNPVVPPSLRHANRAAEQACLG